MHAAHIRKEAYKVLNYACQHCDSELNFTGNISEIRNKLHIDEKILPLALIYLASSGMLGAVNVETDDILKIRGIYFHAINWLADFK